MVFILPADANSSVGANVLAQPPARGSPRHGTVAKTVVVRRTTAVQRTFAREVQRDDSALTETPSVVFSSRSHERRVRELMPRDLLNDAWPRRRDHPVRRHNSVWFDDDMRVPRANLLEHPGRSFLTFDSNVATFTVSSARCARAPYIPRSVFHLLSKVTGYWLRGRLAGHTLA